VKKRLARARSMIVTAAVLAAILPGADAGANGGYDATIRRTEYGIPHIKAEGWGNLGFGVGRAFAEDNICVMADTFVTVNAERARYFGPDGTYRSEANGVVPRNLDSDFYYQWINASGVIEGLVDGTWPHAKPLSATVRDISEGWVAGYNDYLNDIGGAGNITDPACRGAAWVRPITATDLYRRYYQLIMFASKGALLPYIVGAQPPIPTVTPDLGDASQIDRLPTAEKLAIGSNAWALGEASTPNGRGMLLGNPHFPWRGPERFYEFHLTWPGKVNVMGGALFGSPLIHIGTNDHVAWSHTVSVPYRFTPYELKLVPGDPTAYFWDGGIRRMRSKTVSVVVKQPDDSLAPASHTFYEAHFGPVINFQGALMPWTPAFAYALNDANEDNFRALEHFADVNVAQTAEEVYNILARHVGIPWVNTIVADDRGAAFYADMSVVPHVLDDKLLRCTTAVGEALKALARLPVLDGSRSECQPGSDPDAPVPGILGASHLPSLFRRDYVANSNNSHWLPNELQPLEGYAYVTGAERTAITPRARLGLTMIREKLANGGIFTLPELQSTVFNDRQYLGELVRDDLSDACEQTPLVPVIDQSPPGAEVVDISEACSVLRNWDLKSNLTSQGTALFREFVNAAYASNTFWLDVFDPDHPVDTPRKLNSLSPDVRQGLARAVRKLRSAGIPLAAKLGDIQRAKRNGDSIPIHGGSEHGMFNYILSPFNAAEHGYTDTTYGSSFVISATFDGIGKPRAEAILTYSLSTDPTSAHFGDQTWLFSQKQWVPLHMTEDDVQDHLVSSIDVGD
jgi:acyl-homoserine-lactone acylase